MTHVNPYKLASVLLQYPAAALFTGLDELDAAAAGASPKATREAFRRFLGWLAATPPTEVAQHYVETFDLRRRCALYLTYHRHGDTRTRGTAMLAFTAAYRAAGLRPSTDELPDYLPVVLGGGLFGLLLLFKREWLSGSQQMFLVHYQMWLESTFRLPEQVAVLSHYLDFNAVNAAIFFLPLTLPLLAIARRSRGARCSTSSRWPSGWR